MGVTVTCYGGVGEIGGNKILVTDKDTKVFLDFGAGFSEGDAFFSDAVPSRNVNGAGDFLEFGLIPRLQGLYSADALKTTDLKYSAPEIDAIVLSHYHYDHMGRIGLVDEQIPVYCGETTKLLHLAESECGNNGSPLDDHEIRTFRTGDKFGVGSIEFEPIHVDHSIPGAYGFILHTSEGPLAYTGDFRFHGPMGSMTSDFVEAASAEKPRALICEGTRVTDEDPKKEMSEAEVEMETTKILEGQKELVFSSFRGNDLDRVLSFHRACERTGRTFVVSMKIAAMLGELRSDKRLKIPKVGSDILVYARRKRTGEYKGGDYYAWEKKLLDGAMTAADVNRHQKEFFLHLDQRNFTELIDIRPEKGGAYIHATTEAYNEEGERDEDVIRNWVNHFGFSYHQVHASGHAPMAGVAELLDSMAASSVIPVHTERPDLFPSIVKRGMVTAPRKGEPIAIS